MLSFRSCLIDARMLLLTVEQVSLPMGDVWPMRDAERGVEAKGLVIV